MLHKVHKEQFAFVSFVKNFVSLVVKNFVVNFVFVKLENTKREQPRFGIA